MPGGRALAGPRASPLPGGEGSASVGLRRLQEGKGCWDLTVEVTGSPPPRGRPNVQGLGLDSRPRAPLPPPPITHGSRVLFGPPPLPPRPRFSPSS